MANAIRQIVAAASHAIRDDDDDFEQVVNHTRRSFRRRQPLESPRRGRKTTGIFKRKVFLLRRSNCDYLPIKIESQMLTSCGLGCVTEAQFDLKWNALEIEDYICSLYPKTPLKLVGFKLAKVDRQKKLIQIEPETVESLKEKIGQSQIVIIPNRDLPLPIEIPIENVTEQVRSSLQRNTSIQGPRIAVHNLQSEENDLHMIRERDYFENERSVLLECDALLPVIPTLDENCEKIIVTIKRSNCIHDMFRYYEDEFITEKNLLVSFENEMGIDSGGLTKEMFNLFFKEAEHFYFRGEDCIVPFLPLNRVRKDKCKFILIGRILEHMLLLTGALPTKLSKIVLLLIANPEVNMDNNILMEEFYLFVNPCERAILQKAVHNFNNLNNKEKDILSNIFNTNGFYEVPCQDEIFEQVISIATNILIEAPKQFLQLMRQGINVTKYNLFWNRCDFKTLLEMQKLTPAKVANCLRAEETLTNEQSNTLHYLEMYIRCLSQEKIESFVFLITGSFQMPDFITVEFTNLVGLAQRPTFSTCSNTIHIPSTYTNYQELKRDLDICITSEDSYVYTTY